MKTKPFFLSILSLLIFFLLSSCTSVTISTFQGIDVTGMQAKLTGEIRKVKSFSENEEDDILWKTDGLDKVIFRRLFSEEIHLTEWTGRIHKGNSYHAPIIDYRNAVEVRNISGTKYYSSLGFKAFSIMKLPSSYRFKDFNVSKSVSPWDKKVNHTELPLALTSFSIEGKDFSLLLTSMEYRQGSFGDTTESLYNLVTMDDQIFQIMDNEGRLHAEFTKDSYRIFEVDSEFDPQKLWPCIAVFSIIRNLCAQEP